MKVLWHTVALAFLSYIKPVRSLGKENESSIEWSSYRPNLYFGIKPNIPDSLSTGLIWWGVHDYLGLQNIRHTCEQNDGISSFNWIKHDGRSAGIQVIKDGRNNVQLTTSFLKTPGGQNGGHWAVRIQGKPIDPNRMARLSLVHYLALEGQGSLELDEESADEDGIDGGVRISGHASHLGDFNLRIVQDVSNSPVSRGNHADDFGETLDRFQYLGMSVPAGRTWQAKDLLMNEVSSTIQAIVEKYGQQDMPDPALLVKLPNDIRYGANLIGIQKIVEGSFTIDIFYDSSSLSSTLDSTALSAGLNAFSAAYDARFEDTFGLDAKGYSDAEVDFARTLTANLIGGIGYFSGPSIVDRKFSYEYDKEALADLPSAEQDADPRLTEPLELLTATPSRAFFPRGFYWDEGFHLLLIGIWDNDLSLEIFKSWIDLIDDDGWIGREQILGDEARSKVPQEFWVQYPRYGNPPTLPLGVAKFIRRLKNRHGSIADADLSLEKLTQSPFASSATLGTIAQSNQHLENQALAINFLKSIYPPLKRHYEWFRQTQKGQVSEWGRTATSNSEAYRWRGRSEDHVLTSGIDDYPRAKPPHPGELHLDLTCWMGFFTRTMSEIAEYLGQEEDVEEFDHTYKSLVANIDDLFWSEEEQMYCDVSVDANDESFHVCHKGYLSIFPLMLGLLDVDNVHLDKVLEDIRDPAQLWSSYGILSLSKQDEFFGTKEDYWRGPIWIQMNYMVLESLHNTYAAISGPSQRKAQQIYQELRENVIANVYKEFLRTGYAWEQYNAKTGAGQRSRGFTGWTSLVVNLMAESY